MSVTGGWAFSASSATWREGVFGTMRRMPRVLLVGLLPVAVLAGCAAGGEQGGRTQAEPVLPGSWVGADPAAGSVAISAEWWRAFGSDEFSALVAVALEGSPDLAIAVERVRQAEAQVRIAGASLFPVLTGSAASTRRETRPDSGPTLATDSTSATLSASYELDLWGRVGATVSAAQASLRASRYDRETARLTLLSGVASAYFQVLSLRGRLAIARGNIAIAERVYKVVDARVRHGAVSQLDLARQRTAVLSLRAGIPPLEQQERQTLAALALLVGRPLQGLMANRPMVSEIGTVPGLPLNATSVAELAVPTPTPGLPADLLVRRPDLASAEAQLAAANANLAAARAALLPTIQLTGSAGLATVSLLSLTSAPTTTLSLGASLLQTIFDAGRLASQAELASSRERELVENYRRAILSALSDVESALVAASTTLEQERLQTLVRDQAQRALVLAEVRYRAGSDDLLTVLDAQRTLFSAEDQFAQLRLSRLQAAVSLYKALGGGWR